MDNQIPVKLDKTLLDVDGSGKLLPENPAQSNNLLWDAGTMVCKLQMEISDLKKQLAQLQAEAVEREAVKQYWLDAACKYGGHFTTCAATRSPDYTCGCGWEPFDACITEPTPPNFASRVLDVVRAKVIHLKALSEKNRVSATTNLLKAIDALTAEDLKMLGVE